MSVWQMPQACRRTSTSPRLGSPRSPSCPTSGSPNRSSTAARTIIRGSVADRRRTQSSLRAWRDGGRDEGGGGRARRGGDGGVPVHVGGEPATVVDQLELAGEEHGVRGTRGSGEFGEQGADVTAGALRGLVRRPPRPPPP